MSTAVQQGFHDLPAENERFATGSRAPDQCRDTLEKPQKHFPRMFGLGKIASAFVMFFSSHVFELFGFFLNCERPQFWNARSLPYVVFACAVTL